MESIITFKNILYIRSSRMQDATTSYIYVGILMYYILYPFAEYRKRKRLECNMAIAGYNSLPSGTILWV